MYKGVKKLESLNQKKIKDSFVIQMYRHTNLVLHWLVNHIGSSTWFLPWCFETGQYTEVGYLK